MPRYHPEPAHSHGSSDKTAVLLVNLGTPDAPTPGALRRYLKEFLSDPRVVEIPRAIWWLILNGIILNTRPRKSAHKYAKIWTPEGSPLKAHTEKQAKLLRGWLGEHGRRDLLVGWAMRYGSPSIPEVLDQLKAAGMRRLLVVPLYPQYAASTTASVMDAVGAWLGRTRNQPALRNVRNFHDHSGYIAALAGRVLAHWQTHGRLGPGEKLVMSFHGLPQRSLDLGDPYHCECQKTGRLLAEALGLSADQYLVCFQSRFGAAKWLQPYTQPTLEKLAAGGARRVDVICPGFTADCLETLEEMDLECRAAFISNGGERFHYIPCLNEDPVLIETLGRIVEAQLAGWPAPEAPDPAVLQRAQALGAKR